MSSEDAYRTMMKAADYKDFDCAIEIATALKAYLDDGGEWVGMVRRELVRAECILIINKRRPARFERA